MPTNTSRFCIFTSMRAMSLIRRAILLWIAVMYINEQSIPSARDKNIEIISPVMPILKPLKKVMLKIR